MYTGLIVFLGTDDLDATDLFYRKDLGLSIYKQQPTCTIYQVTEQSAIGFCSHLPKVREKKNPILTLLVEDVQKTYKELQKKGVRTHIPYNQLNFSNRTLFFRRQQWLHG